ncbi:MAG TPA: M14 family zinc carboxypeptidase [Bryobacteraceae bacterium]|nr:M14 family zinc carboxypeptidase [Bryobacteraceae bacterium]
MKVLAAILLTGSLFAQIPAPESVLGHKPGDDFYLASYTESLAYFQKLAAATGKLKLVRVGKTSQGRDWYMAIISSPKNLQDFEKYKEIARRLAMVRGLTDAEAHALAHAGKAMVHIDGGLHATEVAGAQHTIQLAYELVTGNTPEINAILDNVILYLWFSINPDGQDMVAKWYKDHLGTAYEVSNLPGLWQEYIGHDNNRDGYMNNMIESQVVTRYELEYYPQVFYDHHQTPPFPARIWIPPFGDPVSAEANPLMWRWVNKFGTSIAAYLDEHAMPGAMHRGRFDDWYPGFIDHVNTFRNTISFLTETALYRYATPHFYTIDEFPRDKQDLRAEIFYPSPWRGGWWRLRDATNMMLGASMAVLDTAAKYREDIEYTRYQAGHETIERFTKDPPYAYVIPRRQRDLPTAATLVEKMLVDGIEVHQSAGGFQANGATYPAGSWVILMDQPFAALVKELFDVQHYPEFHSTGAPVTATSGGGRGAAGGQGPAAPSSLAQLPYDVTGWTLPMQMGVEVIAVDEPVSEAERSSLRKIDKAEVIAGKVEGPGPVYAFSHNSNAALRAVNDILASGGTVSFGKTGETIYATGRVAPILEQNGVDAKSVREAPASWPVKKPRLGIYEPWAGNIDEGWTRWILEQFHFPFARLRNPDIQAGHLRDSYDAIIFAEQRPQEIMDGMQPGTVPGEYAGGIGGAGADALREFVSEGGTLIALGNASLFAIEQFHLPVTNALAGLRPEQFFCSGTLLRAEVGDANHPVMAGLPADLPVMFERNVAFDTRPNFRGKILASYPKDRNPLRSGYLLGPQYIEGKSAAIDANYGSGHIILIGFRAQWRGQSHGTYKLLFNAIYYNPSMAEAGQETSREGGRGGGRDANAPEAPWRTQAEALKNEIGPLLDQNRAFFAARGPRAQEEGRKLETMLDAFQRDRIPQLDDLRAQTEDASAARRQAAYSTQLKKLAADLRTKDLSASKLDDLLEQYKLAAIP